ncbi:MAG: ParB N-terminal domain-containing protein [Candidatus Methanomethylicaceae archaeon]
MKIFKGERERINYYFEKYGHILHPPANFNDLINQYNKIAEIDPEDRLTRIHTLELVEDHENKFIASVKPAGETLLIHEIMTQKQAGKMVKSTPIVKFYEFQKTIAPKEKIEIAKTPEIKEELKDILIDSIYIPPDYLRIRIDYNHVNEIAKSIKEIGQTDPIIVVPINYVKNLDKRYPEAKKYQYILVKGLHRIKAKKLLNTNDIKAIVKYNDYDIERSKSFTENVLLNKLSIYEQSLEFDRDIKFGKSEIEIAKEKSITQSYISKVKRFAKFKKDFGDKHYALTILSYGALDKLYLISLDPDPRQYDFIKKKIIEAYESGEKRIKSKHIFAWCKEYIKPIEEKEKEIQRKIMEEEIQQIQKESKKPLISRIPTQEEIKAKQPIYEKMLKEKKKEGKTMEELFEERINKNIQHANYFTYVEKANLVNDLLKEFSLEEKSKLNIPDLYRALDEIDWNFVKQVVSLDKLKELYKNEIKKQIQTGRIMKKRRLKN